MSTIESLWNKLTTSKLYREEFVASHVKRSIPFQIRSLMKRRGLSQEQLASRANLSQGVISRAANPDYGNLTLNTIVKIAAGFDVAFVGKFVPFSELTRWYADLSEETFSVPSFEEERSFEKKPNRQPSIQHAAWPYVKGGLVDIIKPLWADWSLTEPGALALAVARSGLMAEMMRSFPQYLTPKVPVADEVKLFKPRGSQNPERAKIPAQNPPTRVAA